MTTKDFVKKNYQYARLRIVSLTFNVTIIPSKTLVIDKCIFVKSNIIFYAIKIDFHIIREKNIYG